MTEPQNQDDRLLDHEYDGIKEYDNPLPRWWLATLWGTVVFAVLYVFNIPGIGIGKGRLADYAADSTRQAALLAANDPFQGVTEEMVMAAAANPAQRALGRSLFAANCAACHAADGGGIIGPNLTDNYWIHGGRPVEVFRTAANGVPEKGMPTWKAVLSRDQLLAVVGYVTTLRGTTPAAPKAPQGTPEAASSTQ